LPPDTNELRVVLGSTTPPGRIHRALEGAIERAGDRGTTADLVDLGTLDLGFADGTPIADLGDDTAATIAAIESAGAVILATPIYRGSLSGSLKNLVDLTPVPALQGKVVGLVAMGASDHHFLGAERHLRDVLAFFGAVVMPVAVYLNGGDFEDGVPGERAATVLDELFAGTVATAAALAGVEALREPSPLAARAIKPRPAATTTA
jgi:FMN reductase